VDDALREAAAEQAAHRTTVTVSQGVQVRSQR
jgi:hypothetical protein